MKRAIIATALLLALGEKGYGAEINQANILADSKWTLKLALETDKKVGKWNLFETLTPTVENSPITEIKIGFLTFYTKECNLFSDEQHQLVKKNGKTEGAFGGEQFFIKIKTANEEASDKILDTIKDIHLNTSSFFYDLYFQYTNPKKSPVKWKDYEKYGITELPLNLVWSDKRKDQMIRHADRGILNNFYCETSNENGQILDSDEDEPLVLTGAINFYSMLVIYPLFQSLQKAFPELASPKFEEAFLELNKRFPIV